MGMFILIRDGEEYYRRISLFKRLHHLDPYTPVSSLNPVEYPCLISSIKAITADAHNVQQTDGTFVVCYRVEIINEIYYRSQAKKLVYPYLPKGGLTRPRSRRINNIEELIEFVRTNVDIESSEEITRNGRYGGWSHVNIDRYNEIRRDLQLKQIDDLHNVVRTYHERSRDGNSTFPYFVSFRTINMDTFNNAVIPVITFFLLSKGEAKSLVYHKKNDVFIRQKHMAAKDRITKRAVKSTGRMITINGKRIFKWELDRRSINIDPDLSINTEENIPF